MFQILVNAEYSPPTMKLPWWYWVSEHVCGPSSSMALTMFSTRMSYASSQLMRSNSPSTPFSFVRRMGYLMRFGLLMTDSPDMPRGQSAP